MYESTPPQTSSPQEMYENFATERVVPLGRNSQGNEGQNSQSINVPEGDGAIAKVRAGNTEYLFYRVDGNVTSVALDGGQVVPGTETVLPEKSLYISFIISSSTIGSIFAVGSSTKSRGELRKYARASAIL